MSISFGIQAILSGTILLAVIIFVRKFFGGNVSKKVFVSLWCIAFIRILIPISVQIPIGDFMRRENNVQTAGHISENAADYENILTSEYAVSYIETNPQPLADAADSEVFAFPVWTVLFIVWATGTFIMLVYFIAAYLHNKSKFRYCKCLNDEKLYEFIKSQGIHRHVKILLSDDIASPMTYGIINPVIVLTYESSKHVELILKHEISHIKTLDVFRKALAVSVLSVLWFNPIVWVAVRMFNEDIEYACDERVINSSEMDIRQEYALALIDMQSSVSKTKLPFSSSFSKNCIEERIVLIMKSNKTKLAKTVGVAFAVASVIAVSGFSVFGASDKPNDDITLRENAETNNENAVSSVADIPIKESVDITKPDEQDEISVNDDYISKCSETEKIISSKEIVPEGKETSVVLAGDLSETNEITTFISAVYDCEVYAAQPGICVYYAALPDLGSCVCIKVDTDRYAYYFSLEPYGATAKKGTVAVKVGEPISEGQLIGYTAENGMMVNSKDLGSGAGYMYTSIAPPAAPNDIDSVNYALDPIILKSYRDRGYVLNDYYTSILEDYESFTKTHTANEWYKSENWSYWLNNSEVGN